MTTVVEPVFIDSNALVYARVATSPFHAQAVAKLEQLTQNKIPLCISRQSIREFVVTVTRPQQFMNPLPISIVVDDVRKMERELVVVDETAAVTETLLELLARIPCGGKQVHDANIVATMLVNRIPNLLTHNFADFKRFDHLIGIVPLVA